MIRRILVPILIRVPSVYVNFILPRSVLADPTFFIECQHHQLLNQLTVHDEAYACHWGRRQPDLKYKNEHGEWNKIERKKNFSMPLCLCIAK